VFVLVSLLALCPLVLAQLPLSAPRISVPADSATLNDIASRLSKLSTALSSELEASKITLTQLQLSLKESRNAFESCKSSLTQAASELRQESLRKTWWRLGAVSFGSGLVVGVLRPGHPETVLMAMATGAFVGVSWRLVDELRANPLLGLKQS